MEVSTAPAAGATTLKSGEYDVFINHRGPDVKKTFVAHLYAALISYGIRSFLDAKDIRYAKPVFEEIDKALKGARVHVAVFSKGYAESKYCLEELCAMLKSKQRIIPIFYDVEAENLRRPEDGPYKEAFEKHRRRGRTEKISMWKEALHKVADYKAFRMDEVNGNEHQLIRRIVVEVRYALPPDLLPGLRIGLEKSMKDVVKTLESVSVIGLVGMGGIGKTTLAMEVYNHFLSCRRFERYCFLEDVRSSKTSVLQNKILRDLGGGLESHCNDQLDYTRRLRGALKDRTVLVIVDDISDANKFEALIPEINELGLECRVVITSRARDVLKAAMKTAPAASKALYEVRLLDSSESRRLFNIHAFMSETPSKSFVELAETISDACGGLPLSLTVMGSYLFDKKEPKDKEIWVESVRMLQGNPEIIDKLRICYDGLPTNGDRAMFRDIACMLIGVKQEIAMTIWKSCINCSCSCSKIPASSLRNLIDRSLVKLDEDDKLRMHDVLRDMGREVVKTDGVKGRPRPPKKWTHLWDPVMAEKELSRGEVNTKTRGICLTIKDPDKLDDFQESTISCEASKLGRMQELHLLRLDGCNVVPDDFSSWSQQLRWLQWRWYPFRSFPPQLKLPHLVVLDLTRSTELKCLWERDNHVMVNLAHLVLLDLSYCEDMRCLWENDANVQLPRLEVLALRGCRSLVGLPKHFARSVPKLQRLQMSWCADLRMLPHSIGLLTELQHLDLSNCGEYDVFINHRGPDVKKTFVAHLCAALISFGIRVFMDAKDIRYAEPVFEEIDKALKGACVHVAIFSKGYAESKYCLEELCAMLKSKQWIIPVFYDVEVENLRRPEDGTYKEAFEKHRKRKRTEKIPIWKEALQQVADYRAFRMDEVNENEDEMISKIVDEVRNALPPDLLPGTRIGLEKSMKDVVRTLESVSVIGLVGMGGIGKTTLAMEVYKHFLSCRRFERYCFLEDVQSSQTSVLQNKVLRDLGGGLESHCNDQRDYTRRLRGALKDRRVLVIVDDISDANQFEALIPEIHELGSECRIVITSRRLDVLKDVMETVPAASKAVHTVKMLDKFDSWRLFSFHAFGNETPSKGFAKLAETISLACDGFPLLLEVIGRSLFHKKEPEDKVIWRESLISLRGNPKIIDRLRISYDGLPTDGDRAMFREIACMLIGVKRELAMTIWKSCSNCSCSCSKFPASSLRNLTDRSLVKLDEDDRLRMHDVLRDMGREFVKTDGVKGRPRPPKKWTHLWDTAIAAEELSHGEVNTKTRGICLTVKDPDNRDYFQKSTISCEASKLGRMQELHLLRLDGCNVVPDDFSSWSQQLRWLQWRWYQFRSLPPQLKLPHLVVLDLSWSGELRCLWEKNVHVMLPRLEVLKLGNCDSLVGLPNNFGKSVPKLKRLEMNTCGSSLKTLPDSIRLLTELEHLDLRDCWGLVTLPNAIVGLVGLKTLNLNGCSNMGVMAMESGRSIDLHELDVGFKKLKKLEIKGTRVWPLSTDLGLLTSLSSLSMEIPTGVPARFDKLKALTHLSVEHDGHNRGEDVSMRLSDSLGAFTALQSLRIARVKKISRIPQRLGELKCLRKVQIQFCEDLLHIEALPQCLEHLDLWGCQNLTDIPSLKPMKSLVHLNLEGCRELRHVHGLEWLNTLVFINLVDCASIKDDGVNVNKDNKALGFCALSGSKVGAAYNNGWLDGKGFYALSFGFGIFLILNP